MITIYKPLDRRHTLQNTTHVMHNIIERKEGYLIELATPGFKKEELHIAINENKLIIESNIESSNEESNKLEWYKRSFSKTFKLSSKTDVETISADYKNGILSISISNKVVEPKKVTIH